MKLKISCTVLLIAFSVLSYSTQAAKRAEKHQVKLQKRIPSKSEKGKFDLVNESHEWDMSKTAIVLSDIWDQHWCKGATSRVAEMAPHINNMIALAREKGALIVHSPCDRMNYYKDYEARKVVKGCYVEGIEEKLGEGKLESEKGTQWPLKVSGGGCSCQIQCNESRRPWTKQHDAIKILSGDIISESGVEIGSYFLKNDIENVILVGAHTNMCIMHRSFGLRNMKRLGMNVVLMRDLTDTMYDATSWPYVSHFDGTRLMIEYIEKYVCPTMLSSDFTGEAPFRFKYDTKE